MSSNNSTGTSAMSVDVSEGWYDEDKDTLEKVLNSLGETFERCLKNTAYESRRGELEQIFRQYAQHGSRRYLMTAIGHFLGREDEATDLANAEISQDTPMSGTTAADVEDYVTMPLQTSCTFQIRAGTVLPSAMLLSLNRLLLLEQAQMHLLVEHLHRKYGPSPVFRNGISALFERSVNW